MEHASANILVSELKELILLLKNFGPHICLRVRLQGEMWSQNFVRLSAITNYDSNTRNFSGLILTDEANNECLIIQDISRIIQFEIDRPFKQYQLFIHYTVLLFEQQQVGKG